MPITEAAASAGRAGGRRRRLRAAAFLLFALLIAFPALVPGAPAGLRTSEVVGLAANAALALALLSGAALHRAAVPIAVAALLSVPWIWAEFISIATFTADNPARFTLIRWLMGLATGYWLAVLMDDDRSRSVVGTGLVLGLLLSLGTIVHDHMTFDLSKIDLAQLSEKEIEQLSAQWAAGEYRAAGILGHPNNAAAVALLVVPLIIGLVEERRLPRGAVLVAAVAIGAVLVTTKTRGATLIAAALLMWHLFRGSPMRAVLISVAIAFAVGAAAVVGVIPMGGGDDAFMQRFTDTEYTSHNANERVLTTLAALELALANPLGMGSSYIDALMLKTGGLDSTHNAFGQLALMGGLPVALFVAARMFANASLPASPARVTESWVALFLAGAFMFENLFFAPTLTIATVWLLWRPSGRAAAAAAIPDRRHGAAAPSGAWPLGNDAGGGADDGLRAPGRRAKGTVTLLPPPPREPSAAPARPGPPRPGAP